MEENGASLSEALWFTAVTVSLSSMVFLLCGILELVERYNLFKGARIQEKVNLCKYLQDK